MNVTSSCITTIGCSGAAAITVVVIPKPINNNPIDITILFFIALNILIQHLINYSLDNGIWNNRARKENQETTITETN
ncbi:hypothetical protein D1164_11100 [Mariniphaga sediminis]|uniref:Uncharacterized protein n=1 Tax=Mariniphaga sediminis TaxID=1628158 RepID=A0A399CZE1_9BACT|nr:hypothetical protein D1164_11100 [Mariniphaga sediminis]